MKYAEVALNVKRLLEERPSDDEFIYELLLAYGTPKATIARLKKGQLNQAKMAGEILLKKKVWFKPASGDLLGVIDELRSAKALKRNDPRFLIVTDFKQLLAVDRKTADTLDIDLEELDTRFDFFLPWAGMEKKKLFNENRADVKAAEKMARLFDCIRQDNPDYVQKHSHWMNIFLSRLLFCLFAEDTGIFPKNAMCNAIASYTAEDGTDLTQFFERLFEWLDLGDSGRKNLTTESTESTEELDEIENSNVQHSVKTEVMELGYSKNCRAGAETPPGAKRPDPQSDIPDYLKEFPYVNGGLFKDHYAVPVFSRKSRRMIIESGTLNWSEINPDIFGSMFQAVIDPEERHNLGQHYTSVTNIMKVIEPLFLNNFKEDLYKARELTRGKKQALYRLLERIAKVKIFDPACGSGNFLIIAYKELRKLEMDVFKELQPIESTLPLSGMTVSQFYGIEIADFACETAILALWLAEHQMNLESKKVLGQAPVSLPLKDGANVVCGNACRLDWEAVCPKNEDDEIYVLGNPPYYGSSLQTAAQKSDMSIVFSGKKNYKNLDYIACWFLKGSDYIYRTDIPFAFVTTNSVCQGEQVDMLWPHIFNNNLEIGFAHQSFIWSNNAKNKAAVSCVIIGVRRTATKSKIILSNGLARVVDNINPYLVASATNLIIKKRRKPISKLPPMTYGNKPADGGNLILTTTEKNTIVAQFPETSRFVRKLMGAHEFTEGTVRWCLWIESRDLEKASSIPIVNDRLEAVREMRENSTKEATRELAEVPHQFGEIRHQEKNSILVPRHGSARRDYMPFGFLTRDVIVVDSVQVIYSDEIWVFGVISSKAHNIWIKATCGKIKDDPRYSSALGYNTFPVPPLTESQKHTITMHVGEVLSERERHSEKTMAQLYDPDKMPDGLREAHHQLDLAVDRLYRSKPFASDEERLEHLFKLYEEMTAGERLI